MNDNGKKIIKLRNDLLNFKHDSDEDVKNILFSVFDVFLLEEFVNHGICIGSYQFNYEYQDGLVGTIMKNGAYKDEKKYDAEAWCQLYEYVNDEFESTDYQNKEQLEELFDNDCCRECINKKDCFECFAEHI